MRNLLLIAALIAPLGNYIDNGFYLVRTSVEHITGTEQSIQAAESVVGVECPTGLGSATYIGDGLFVTAHHVVEGCENLPIIVRDHHLGKIYSRVYVVAYDADSDVAILHTKEDVITPAAKLAWGDPKEGDLVHGVGFGVSYSDNREGCERRLWSGIVTDYTLNIGGNQPNAIQSTNPAIPGDSGGALFNSEGELIGPIHATDYIHTYSIRNACVHQLLRRYEHDRKEEAKASGADS